MQNIALYLERFKSLGIKEEEYRKRVQQAAFTVCGVTIDDKKIAYKNGVVTINVSGPAKTLIFLHKEKIEAEVKKMLDNPKEISNIS